MSVVLWDGRTLAADRAIFRSGVVSEIKKIVENDKYAAGFVGRYGPGLALARWAIAGADPATFDSDWKESEVICVNLLTGTAHLYDGHYAPIPVHGPAATGETAACAAGLALALAGVPANDAVQLLVDSKRFDGVGFGVQYVRSRHEDSDHALPATPPGQTAGS